MYHFLINFIACIKIKTSFYHYYNKQSVASRQTRVHLYLLILFLFNIDFNWHFISHSRNDKTLISKCVSIVLRDRINILVPGNGHQVAVTFP